MMTSGAGSGLLLLVALTSGCGNSDSGAGGAGGNGTGGGNADPNGPLLGRPSGGKYTCTISRPIARLAMPWGEFSLVPGTAAGELVVAATDRTNPDPSKWGNGVAWSTLGLDGKLGSPSVLRAPTNLFLGSVTVGRDDERSTIIWDEAPTSSDIASLNSLQVNASGAVVTPASVLPTLGSSASPKIAKAGSGYALLWVESPGLYAKLSFGLLDASGKLASPPVMLAQGHLSAGNIVSVGDHFAVGYADFQASKLRILFLASDGSVLGEPVEFENSQQPLGFGATIPSLLAHGDQVLAAWSATSMVGTGSATTVRVARFDSNGERQGQIYDLQAPLKDRERVQPFWVEMGDDVGLLWANGSIIYICAGCVPNHLLNFIVLDGQDFTPQSELIGLENTLQSGGLLSPETVRIGDNLLVVSTVTYHTSGEGASATIRCVK